MTEISGERLNRAYKWAWLSRRALKEYEDVVADPEADQEELQDRHLRVWVAVAELWDAVAPIIREHYPSYATDAHLCTTYTPTGEQEPQDGLEALADWQDAPLPWRGLVRAYQLMTTALELFHDAQAMKAAQQDTNE